MKKQQIVMSTKTIAYTAVMTALVTVATMFLSIKTGESNTNLGDTMIFLSAMLFSPITSTIAGGLGSFLADLLTWPATMWFTLVIKGLEGLICGLICHFAKKIVKDNPKKVVIQYVLFFVGMIVAAAWMVFGYYIAKAFMYGTKESALVSLPKNCVQGSVSVALATVLYAVLYPVLNGIIKTTKKKAPKKQENSQELEQEHE